ncbi:MAG: hypothetical protein ACHQQQ_01550 [Bacteroidota bacterium]
MALLVVMIALLPAIFSSCKDNTSPSTPAVTGAGPHSASISGIVNGKRGSGNQQPLAGAVVSLQTIYGLQDTLTDAHGAFAFTVQFPDSAKASNATISASELPDFDVQTQNLIIRPGSDVAVPFLLTAKDTTTFPPTSGPFAKFVFIGQTSNFANVLGDGGIQVVSFTFECRDSVDIPLDTTVSRRVKVYFKLQPAIGGGEKLSADSLYTSNIIERRGRVTVDLQVGTVSGIVQVQAWAKKPSGAILSASSSPLPIYSGPPSPDHFQMSSNLINFPGLDVKGVQNIILVQLGDRWSNPVRRGTPLIFSTSTGIIQANDSTDADGKASAILTSGDPPSPDGIAHIFAQTIGDSGKIVKDSIAILITGAPLIVPPPESLYMTISGGTSLHIPYHVYDRFKHPLAAGSKIKISLAGDGSPLLLLSGDIDVTLPDTKDTSFSSFAIDLRDTIHTYSATDKPFQLAISVTSPNGNLTRTYLGTVSGTIGGGSTGSGPAMKVASIVLSSVSDQQISVQGTGAKQTSILTFLALDRNGRFIPLDSAWLHFTLFPNTLGASIFPDSGKTDAQGHVQAILSSGKTSGVVQVTAYSDTGIGLRVSSSPVPVTIASGLPVLSHYSLSVTRFNIPGLNVDGLADTLMVSVGDINGNPVQSNTAVYFKTDGGIIQASAYTNPVGQGTSIIRSANPRTANGIVTVTASTIDTSGTPISRNAQIIFSGYPIINVKTDTIYLGGGVEKTLSWSVADKNGNPLAMGNVISAQLIGNNANQVKFVGDLNTTLADYPVGAGLTNFSVAMADTVAYRVVDSYLTLQISSSGPNGNTTPITIPVKLMKSTNPSIALIKKIVVSADQNRIYVSGTGALSTSHLTFNIQDANGVSLPIKGMPINVNLSGAIGTVDSSLTHTDSLGNAYAIFSSASDTGIAYVQGQVGDIVSAARAITILPGRASVSYSGLWIIRPPDTLLKVNIPGANINIGQKVGEIHLKVKDRYNNPVQPGTNVLLATNAGLFPTSTDSITLSTDRSGNVSTDLFGGNPTPNNGQATITAYLPGENGATVTKTLSYVYSGAPLVSFITPLNPSFIFKNLVDTSLTFSVKDLNGNPLAAGATITVTVIGAGGGTVKLLGDVSKVMPDTRDTNNTRFTIQIQDTNRVITTDMNLGIVIQVDGPNGTKRAEIDGTLKAAPPSPFKLLTFKSMTFDPITVTGVGGQQTTDIVYEIQDSTGKAIKKSGVDVQFMLASLTASITPQHDTTDVNGQVKATIQSGTSAETLQVRAVANGIYSVIQQILVQAGPPDQAFFSMQLLGLDGKKKTNFPGAFNAKDAIGLVQVQVKDVYGNIVKIGTPIKFNKNAGSMAAFGFTDKNGIAQTTWLGGTPIPSNGIAYVTASALDKNNNVVAYDSSSVLYTGPAQVAIAGILPSPYYLSHGIDTTITFTVKDSSNNPLAAGSIISVTASGDGASSLFLSGNVNVTLPDTRIPGVGTTIFSVRIQDTNSVITSKRPVTLSFAVSGPNGTASVTSSDSLSGAPDAIIAGLGIVAVGNPTVTVKNAGGMETSLLTFELRDALDRPIRRKGVTVYFSSQGIPGNSGTFTPDTVQTDSAGRAITLFHSGTVAGVVHVFATTMVTGSPITSSNLKLLVVGGRPDQKYFTFILTRPQAGIRKVNFPGELPVVQKIGVAQVQVGDMYGNPVPAGTQIYYKTNAGVIQGSAVTDANGFATVDWFGGNPQPAGDSALVYAMTLGVNDVQVYDSAIVTYSGQAMANITGIPAIVSADTNLTFSYTVSDLHGNPLSEGSSIQVTASGPGASSVLLMGDVNVTMPDTRSKAMTAFNITLRDTNTTITTSRSLTISVSVNGPNGSVNQQVMATLKGITPPPVVYARIAGLSSVIVTAAQLNVANTGGVESSLLAYELRDSLNNPIHKPGVRVDFFAAGDTLGSAFNPSYSFTDSLGRAQTIFSSGTRAGIVEIKATTLAGAISSGLLKIVIVGGKPDQKYFTLVLARPDAPGAKFNFPGALNLIQKIGVAQVQMGDRYGNPVPQGTPVYFTTNAGIIQGSGVADANGLAQVDWFGGMPIPPAGKGWVTAQAIGLNDSVVTLTDSIIYSGQAAIAGGPADGFQIPGGGTATYSFRIEDQNNNPIAAGSVIRFSVSGTGASAIILTGDTLITTTDSKTVSTYNVTVRDTSTFSTMNRSLQISIDVTGPNGSAHQTSAGSLLSTGAGRSRLPATIALISTSTNDLQVTGTGGTETATMIYELRDSVGVPVDSAYNVKFTLIPNFGGAFISPASDTCDPKTGRINAVIHAGTAAGAFQAVATVTRPFGDIVSTPVRILVHAGQPDSAHFSIGANPLNVAGLDINGKQSLIGILLGDKWSNPVPQGTAVYFSTSQGVVTTNSGFTDQNGMASVTLFSGNPRSADGFGFVSARTVGANGADIHDSVRVLFSGAPVIDSVRVTPSNVTDFNVAFRVADRNKHPLAAGTTISITTSGNVTITTSAVIPSNQIPDTQDPFWTNYSFNCLFNRSASPPVTGPFTLTINVTGPNGNTSYSINAEAKDQGNVIFVPTLTGIAGLKLVSVSNPIIRVKDAGGVDLTIITYQLVDSIGLSVPKDSIMVYFNNLSGPTLGSFGIDSAYTDIRGQATTIFHSNTQAGIAQVTSSIPHSTITSSPTKIIITGGDPDSTHTTLTLGRMDINGAILSIRHHVNFPGLTDNNSPIGLAQVRVGDKYNNPVPTGTPVYFTTNAGIIAGSGNTDSTGFTEVIWYGGRPYPTAPAGLARVQVTAINQNIPFTVTDTVIYSGPPVITAPVASNFVFPAGIDSLMTYSVLDANGNPMAGVLSDIGTPYSANMAISVVDQTSPLVPIDLSGDILKYMRDTRNPADGTFHFRLTDLRSSNTNDITLTLSITYIGPNGQVTKALTGTLLANHNVGTVAGINLVTASNQQVSVKNTGGVESSLLTYQIVDSLGNSLRRNNEKVVFKLSGNIPGSFTPDTVVSDVNGQVQTVFHSDTISGIARITAYLTAENLTSTETDIVIAGGKPALKYFSFVLTRSGSGTNVNFPGAMPVTQQIGTAEVRAGDKYGNPVPAGTPITFRTNAGVIQGSGMTDANGLATVQWFGGNPIPAGGNATVKVSAVSDTGSIAESLMVTYSGQVIIDSLPKTGFIFHHGIDTTISIVFRDSLFNPISSGAQININFSGPASSSLLITSNYPSGLTTPDTRTLSKTTFVFHVVDTSQTTTGNNPLTIAVSVSGANGTAATSVDGTLLGSSSGSTETIAGINLVGISTTLLTVKNTGGTESSLLTYQLLDTLQKPIRQTGVQVTFKKLGVPGTFTPASVLTDVNGQAQTVFHSDTLAGIVNVSAQTGSPAITSSQTQLLIAGGRPSQKFFTFNLTRTAGSNVNFPGAVSVGQKIGEAQVQAGDKYGNPVPQGTFIYFTTNAGVIQSNSTTDVNGFAKVDWFSGNPIPAGGLAKIKVSAIGDTNTVTDSAIVVYSGAPIANIIRLAPGFSLRHNIDTTLTYSVKDTMGNPISQGSIIQFTAIGTGASALLLSGQVNVTMWDTKTKSDTLFQVRIQDTSTVASVNRALSLVVSVSGPNGSANQQVDGTLIGAVGNQTTAGISRLNLISASTTQLSVINGGGIQTSLLTYELEDSLGNPVRQESVQVHFTPNGVPGTFTPSTTITDVNGRVQTTFTSDTLAGVVEVLATLVGKGISSTQAHLVIVGGRPALNNFTFLIARTPTSGAKINYPGAVPSIQNIGMAQVQVGDRYGNPVPVGTNVYFKANAGVIQGTASTDGNGFATVSWFGGNPIPLDENAILQASAMGDTLFTVKDTVVYSGEVFIPSGPPSNFQIPGAGVSSFAYQITDALGKPIAEGSTITVTATGQGAAPLVLSGNVNVVSPDTKNLAKTNYSFTVFDSSTSSTTNRPVTFTISINGPNGSTSQSYSGTLLAIGVSHGIGDTTRSRLPGSIALISVSNTDIQVAGTGGTETSTLVFEVRDSLGVPVDSSYQVKFSLLNPPKGAYISPISGRCDSATGRINAVLHADSVAGVVQILATVVTPTGSIISSPVLITIHSGLPDQRHFSLYSSQANFAGLQLFNKYNTINVIVGDKYSNPVAKGTAVYFNTRGGVVTPSGFTDDKGEASVTLISGRPFPDSTNPDPDSGKGFGKVFATTSGLNSAVVQDSILILFSGIPIASYGGPGSFSILFGACQNFDVTVADMYGHPISPGSKIYLTAKTGASGATVSDPVVMPDVQHGGPGLTHFILSFCTPPPDPKNPPPPTTATITLNIDWEGNTYTITLASGTIN